MCFSNHIEEFELIYVNDDSKRCITLYYYLSYFLLDSLTFI